MMLFRRHRLCDFLKTRVRPQASRGANKTQLHLERLENRLVPSTAPVSLSLELVPASGSPINLTLNSSRLAATNPSSSSHPADNELIVKLALSKITPTLLHDLESGRVFKSAELVEKSSNETVTWTFHNVLAVSEAVNSGSTQPTETLDFVFSSMAVTLKRSGLQLGSA